MNDLCRLFLRHLSIFHHQNTFVPSLVSLAVRIRQGSYQGFRPMPYLLRCQSLQYILCLNVQNFCSCLQFAKFHACNRPHYILKVVPQ